MTAYYVTQYLRLADVIARLDAQPHRSVSQKTSATTDDAVEQDCADLQVDLFVDSLVDALEATLAHGFCCKAEHFRGLDRVRRQETVKDELVHGAQRHVSNDTCTKQPRIVSDVLRVGSAAVLKRKRSDSAHRQQQQSRERVPCSWHVPLVCSDWMMDKNGLKYISVSISLICVRDEI